VLSADPRPGVGGGSLVLATSSAKPGPTVPAAVLLSWLDGVSSAPAIRRAGSGFTLWQGTVPGEQAQLLADGGYRWRNAAGAFVGCAASPAGRRGRPGCVGVDPAGEVAIVDGASTTTGPGNRILFGSDGRWQGDFDSTGVLITGAHPVQSLAQEIIASGIDMAALVDFATRAAPFAGGVTGDPHLITAGGERVSSMQAGDFQARTDDPVHQIQLRVEVMPYRTDVAYVTAAAVGFNGHRVEFQRTGRLLVDDDPMPADGKFRQYPIQGGSTVGWWPPDAAGIAYGVVLWPDGSTVSIGADAALGMSVFAQLPTSQVGGLFGTRDAGVGPSPAGSLSEPTPTSTSIAPIAGSATIPRLPTDFRARPGVAVATSVEAIVASWRVKAGESLFAEPLIPAALTQAAVVSPVAIAVAQNYCNTAGMTNPADTAACVFDVARTGDQGYVANNAQLAAAATQRVAAPSIALDWPALQLGAVSTATQLALGAEFKAAIAPRDRQVYLFTLDGSTAVTVKTSGCAGGVAAKALPIGSAALRVFDGTGRAVSGRSGPCGRVDTEVLPAGSYYLLLAGGSAGGQQIFTLKVTAG